MKVWRLVFLLSVVAALGPMRASSAVMVDPVTIEAGVTDDTLTLSWFGRAGQTYFMLTSDDLVTWTSLPLVEVGADEPLEYTFTLPDGFVKRFWRLAVTDQTATDPQAADFDGDGLPTWWELQHGLNPLFAGDAFGDPDLDELTNLAEFRLGLNPRDPAVVRTPTQLGFRLFSP